MTTHVDPVCGMPVTEERARPLEYATTRLWFCSEFCRQQYLRHPRAYEVDAPRPPQTVHWATRRVAYFSMEVALANDIPTYAGGLGVLADDTLRSCADLCVPVVGVSLVHRQGYFRQEIHDDWQIEREASWAPDRLLQEVQPRTAVTIEGRELQLRAWRYDLVGSSGYIVPVLLLDTDVPANSPEDRRITDHLYGGDLRCRLMQEIVLGVGGVRLLQALDCTAVRTFHLNEGHAAARNSDLRILQRYDRKPKRLASRKLDVTSGLARSRSGTCESAAGSVRVHRARGRRGRRHVDASPRRRAHEGSADQRGRSLSANYTDSRLRGRPPFAPFSFAAAVLAFDLRRPPRCPVAAANRLVPNARSTSPGTYTSTSSDRQERASPAGETLIDRRAEAGAPSRPGMPRRGIVIDPPPRNVRLTLSRSASYRAPTTPDGSCERVCPCARARAKRSRSLAVTFTAGMECLPFLFQELRMSRHQLLRAFHVAIGDRADDLDRVMSRQVDLHDSTSFRDVHVRRRMIESVHSDLESVLANQRRHL